MKSTKKNKMAAGVAALAVSASAFTAPAVLAQDTTGSSTEELSSSQEASSGVEITPEGVVTVEISDLGDDVDITDAYVVTDEGVVNTVWDVTHDGDDEVTVTAPAAPENDEGLDRYGEHTVIVETDDGEETSFTLNFVAEPSTPGDGLQEFSSNLSSDLPDFTNLSS